MPEETASKAWLEEKAGDLGEGALLFVEGYEWTGLGVWRGGEFAFPEPFDWRISECEDIRLFHEQGEWHCWRIGRAWESRWAKAGEWVNCIERKHVMWGRAASGDGPWWRITEGNGASLAIPFEPKGDLEARPMRLVVWHRVDEAEETGQQYIGDAMFRRLEQVED